MDFYKFNAIQMNGVNRSMKEYQGKVVLIVNTASKCGFTPQLQGLETLYQKYQAKGFVILGFPCNQFGHQDPGDNSEISEFCLLNYGVTFPMFQKIDVNGENEHPLFHYLKKQAPGAIGTKIKWNFTKFLIDQEGTVIKRYAPTTTPERIEKDLLAYFKV